ncbi:MAG: winged helix-turn-helix domain-containing protein [Sphingomonas sp.]
MSRRSLLLVGGERSVADDLRWYLEREHFLVHQAATGKDALTLISQSGADIVLIDEIDDMSPNNLCEQLRARPAIAAMPVIVLTAENDDQTRVKALNAGADDCVARPFSAIELIARVHAVLRRVSPELIGAKLTLGDVEMDLAAHRVRRRGKIIQLGHVEYKILRHFLENPGRVFARAQLVRLLWKNESDIQLRTIDSHIRRLRKTLNTGGLPDLFRTVRAVGYSIELEPVKWVMALLLGYWGLPDSFA